jgi:site-specific recombinase XerD
MDIENLIAVFERKLILQRYSDGSIKNYSSSVRSFLQVAEKRFDQPDELNENEIEKYVYRKIRTILAVPISDLQMCCFVRGLFILSFFSFSVFM